MKSSFIAIIGRPSAGKSTLVNYICNEKISIVSPLPQTTRNKIKGIYNDQRGQLVFIDTPGFHLSDKKFNKKLTNLIAETINDTDMVLYLVDMTRKIEEEENTIVKMLKGTEDRVLLVFNKIDIESKYFEENKEILSKIFSNIFYVSAVNGTNVKDLLDFLFLKAQDDIMYYPKEYKTDSNINFRIEEIVREKIILNTHDEIPYSVFVKVLELVKRKGNLTYIRCSVIVDTDSQKAIIIGKKASMIKNISMSARKDLENLLGKNYLELFVKVKKNWLKDDNLLNNIIN